MYMSEVDIANKVNALWYNHYFTLTYEQDLSEFLTNDFSLSGKSIVRVGKVQAKIYKRLSDTKQGQAAIANRTGARRVSHDEELTELAGIKLYPGPLVKTSTGKICLKYVYDFKDSMCNKKKYYELRNEYGEVEATWDISDYDMLFLRDNEYFKETGHHIFLREFWNDAEETYNKELSSYANMNKGTGEMVGGIRKLGIDKITSIKNADIEKAGV